jgi:RNA polymerase sigma factor (sigma-70 family)
MQAAEQHLLFDRWLAEHAAVLHHVANGFAEGADRHDLMQELLLAVWRAVPAYRGGAQPSTFLYRVAHNTALTWKRSERNYRRKVDHFEAEVLRATQAEPAVLAREQAALTLLYAHIRRLPPVDRSLILLHLDGVNYAGMAEIHGLTETNVGVRLNRLKQRLTDAMEEISHELR